MHKASDANITDPASTLLFGQYILSPYYFDNMLLCIWDKTTFLEQPDLLSEFLFHYLTRL